MWVSVPDSTTDSQELALNCTVHKILLTLCLISDSYYNFLSKPLYSLTESGKLVKGLLIWTSHLKIRVGDVWMENSQFAYKPRWRDLLTWDLLLSDFIPFLTFKSHLYDSLLIQWYIGLLLYLIWWDRTTLNPSTIDVMVDSPSKKQKTARYWLPSSGN